LGILGLRKSRNSQIPATKALLGVEEAVRKIRLMVGQVVAKVLQPDGSPIRYEQAIALPGVAETQAALNAIGDLQL
jgi:hypothetical protein